MLVKEVLSEFTSSEEDNTAKLQNKLDPNKSQFVEKMLTSKDMID